MDSTERDLRRDLHEQNRLSWNAATAAHNSHKGDQGRYFREGGSNLGPEEVDFLGDVAGKRVVHLQCNAGQDTLSIARLGAAVTGVDISDTAIETARTISADSGIPATFVRSDIFDWFEEAVARGERYDVVFLSFGAICWLSDLERWAKGIASVLEPGGRLAIVEFHPVAWMFDEDWKHIYPYFAHGQPYTWEEGVSDYVAQSGPETARFDYQEGVVGFANPHPVHEFFWGIGDILGAILRAGLRLDRFEEYPYFVGFKAFNEMRAGEERRYYPPERIPALPMMYAIAATKAE